MMLQDKVRKWLGMKPRPYWQRMRSASLKRFERLAPLRQICSPTDWATEMWLSHISSGWPGREHMRAIRWPISQNITDHVAAKSRKLEQPGLDLDLNHEDDPDAREAA